MYSRYNIPEADWKLLRRVHRDAVERFSDQTLAEAQRLIQDGARSAHQRYLDLYKMIEQRDEQMARLFDNPRRSVAVHMLAQLRGEGLLPDEEFSSLSADTRAAIGLILGEPPDT